MLHTLVPVTIPKVVQAGYVYKASGDALKHDGVSFWVVTNPGISHASVLGFDAHGVATTPRTIRCEELRKRKPLGLLPIRALCIVEVAP